ncbi:MAG TPA: hypothetical protein PKY38_06740 [Opitutaceae bacterium]|nr:hypothetical protein [Opitutaceae bacterium]
MKHEDTLITDEGMLTFHFKLHTPRTQSEELPNPPYIFIDWIAAEPPRRGLLKKYASKMIARIREKLGSDREIIFQPANGDTEDDPAQEKLKTYYQSCGFDYLPSSSRNFWMTWPRKN